MKQSKSCAKEFSIVSIFIILLAIPLAFYWRYDLFFMWDDWTELDLMAHNNFIKYLILPDGEIFFPFFHLVFYGLIKLFGEHYSIYVLLNCLGIGVVSCLLYLFLKRHFSCNISLVIAILYAAAPMQQAIAWNAFYLSYILSLGFFLLALLLTDQYVRSPNAILLVAVGLSAFLSIHSHNYTLLALMSIPFYPRLMRGDRALNKFLALFGVVAIVLFSFCWEYLFFVGLKGVTFYNREVFSSLPGANFYFHWFCGAFLSPLSFLFWGYHQSPEVAFFFGLAVWVSGVGVIWLMGGARERSWGLFALLVNALPFLSVSLVRHQISLSQALMVRYIFFTLLGALLLSGTAWNILSTRFSRGMGFRLISLVLITIMALGQLISIPIWQKGYLELSRKAWECYQEPELFAKGENLWLTPHHPLEKRRFEDIRRFLKGSASSQVESLAERNH
jgi:hypothetical protein